MALQLNEQVIPYREFYGPNIKQMPLLVADGRVPMSVSGLMQRRLEVSNGNFSPEVKSAWMDNYFDTGDGIVYHPNGRVKLVLDAKPLREINAKTELKNGALVLPHGMYEALEGHEFTRDQIKDYVERSLTSDQAKSNPMWKALARDPKLLNEYVDSIFAQAKQRFQYDENMGLYLASTPKEPQLRSLCVDRLGSRSNAYGRFGLDDGDGRLVGVAPEARVAQDKALTLEQRV